MTAKIIIVDENNVPIGSKFRNELDHPNDIYRATGIWITNSKGEVLIAKRAFTKDSNPGKWGPAASGTVEEGETYESNAYKELEEELGVTGIPLTELVLERVTGKRNFFGQWYKAVIDWPLTQFVIQEEEVVEIMWVDRTTLKQDVADNPEKYTPSLPRALNLLP